MLLFPLPFIFLSFAAGFVLHLPSAGFRPQQILANLGKKAFYQELYEFPLFFLTAVFISAFLKLGKPNEKTTQTVTFGRTDVFTVTSPVYLIRSGSNQKHAADIPMADVSLSATSGLQLAPDTAAFYAPSSTGNLAAASIGSALSISPPPPANSTA